MFEEPQPVALEPLAELARFSWNQAPHLCDPRSGCCSYHRVWSTIRLMEIGGAAPAGRAFYRHGLQQLAGRDRPRILVSGGADTGVMALTADICRELGIRAHLVFTDICETPVAQNRLFAERTGLQVECIRADILDLVVEPVDAVVSHSFINFFPPEIRPKLLARWTSLLLQGGLLLATSNIAPEGMTEPLPQVASHLAERAARLRCTAEASGFPKDELDELEREAGGFLLNRGRHLPPTEAGLRSMIADAGLSLELVAFDSSMKTRGPATRGKPSERYLRSAFMARKS